MRGHGGDIGRGFRNFWIVLLVLAGALVGVTGAEEPVTVETEERLPEASRRSPTAAVSVIDVAAYEGTARTLAEVLATVPGVNIQRFGGLGKLATVTVRGSTAEQVCVFLDGVPLHSARGAGVDLSTIPLERLARIEVARGSASAEYGEGCVGGAILLFSREGGTDERPLDVGVEVAYGSFSTGEAEVFVDAERGGHRLHVSLNGFVTAGDYPFEVPSDLSFGALNDDFTRENNFSRTGGGLLRYAFTGLPSWTLRVSDEVFLAHVGVPGPVNNPTAEAWQRDFRNTLTLEAEGEDIAVRGLGLRAQLYRRDEGLRYVDPSDGNTGATIETRLEGNTTGLQVEPTFAFPGGHELALELSAHTERLRDTVATNDLDARRDRFSGRLRGIGRLGARWFLSAVARWQHDSDFGTQDALSFGVSVLPTDWLEVRGNIGEGYRVPSFRELSVVQGAVVGNPDLVAETSRSADLGVEVFGRRFNLALTGYYTDYEDLIQYIFVSGFRSKPFNIGRAIARGLEFTGTWTPHDVVTLSGSYTVSEVIDLTDTRQARGLQLPGRPIDQGNVRIDGTVGRFSAFAEYFTVGANPVTPSNRVIIGRRHVVNVATQVQVGGGVTIGAEVKNLFDATVYDLEYYPLPGRYFGVSLRWRVPGEGD